MQFNPLVFGGIGAAVVAGGVGVGLGLSKASDALIAANPTTTKGDNRAMGLTLGTAALGVVGGGVLMTLGALGKIHPGFAIGGAVLGAGMLLGSIGAGIATSVRHGKSIDTMTANTMSAYDRWPANGSLNLDGGFLRPPETFRSESDSYKDSDGKQHTTTTVYTIANLAEAADARGNVDRRAEPGELRSVVASFDADGDKRIRGSEAKAFDRAYGERVVYSSHYSTDVNSWWNDTGYSSTPMSPGDDY
ncbi:MAG: hypothetical protein H7287_07235 [Thermoleophilia bacterium]|nr:hypothetical protein [Thermoleophilia bacterium]